MQAGAGTNTMRDGHKKAPPKAGPEKESGLQSGLGRRDQGSGDALAEAAAPAEGGASTEQGQGAGDSSGGWVANEHLNCLAGAGKGPGADQASRGEAKTCKCCAIERGATDNWVIGDVSRIKY